MIELVVNMVAFKISRCGWQLDGFDIDDYSDTEIVWVTVRRRYQGRVYVNRCGFPYCDLQSRIIDTRLTSAYMELAAAICGMNDLPPADASELSDAV